MQELNYFITDVFTDTRFGGNPLAVFPKADGLSPALMQKIANEFNLSETTFVQKAQNENSDCSVRIFTPALELPMAGHPTIGTAFILLINSIITPKAKGHLIFDEGVGPIKVNYQSLNDKNYKIIMEQPLPVFGKVYPEKEKIAEILSLKASAIPGHLPVQVVSCGVPIVIVPIRSLEEIKIAKVRIDLLEKYLADFDSQSLFLFTQETIQKYATVHSRFFAPTFGITEDPATGGASGPLGAYLVKYKLSDGKGIVSEQGIEMGRSSTIYIDIETKSNQISGVKVGGTCISVGKGSIVID